MREGEETCSDISLTYPLASDCQYGANNPENAGTKYTSEVSPTCLAIASTMSEK